jgi:hypothetical protein
LGGLIKRHYFSALIHVISLANFQDQHKHLVVFKLADDTVFSNTVTPAIVIWRLQCFARAAGIFKNVRTLKERDYFDFLLIIDTLQIFLGGLTE